MNTGSVNAIGLQSLQAGKLSAIKAGAENAAAAAAADKSDAKIKEIAQSFESMFIAQMFEHMNEGVEPDPNFGGGQAEQMFKSLLNDQYAQELSKRGGVGIAPAVERFLKGTQLQAQEIKQ